MGSWVVVVIVGDGSDDRVMIVMGVKESRGE